MLFGYLPIVNIPVFIAGIGVLVFGIGMLWSDYKDEQHAKEVARVRRAEIHRRAMKAMTNGRRERTNKCIGRYHGLV